MNLLEQENYEFIRDTLQGKHETRYTMPKAAKFLVGEKGKMVIKLEVNAEDRVLGYYSGDRTYYFNKAKDGPPCEVLRKQVDLV